MIYLHTDGASSGNPGPGGWAVVITMSDRPAKKELSASEPKTTNVRMEMTAVYKGLSAIKTPSQDITVVTDLEMIVKAFNEGWIQTWQANGWKKSSGEPVANQDLWKAIADTITAQKHRVTFQWVEGHTGNPLNERANELAQTAARMAAKTTAENTPQQVETQAQSVKESYGLYMVLLSGQCSRAPADQDAPCLTRTLIIPAASIDDATDYVKGLLTARQQNLIVMKTIPLDSVMRDNKQFMVAVTSS